MSSKLRSLAAGFAGIVLFAQAVPARAQEGTAASAGVTYADIADLADSSGLVIHAQIRKLVRVADERSPGLKQGMARFYVQADTKALLTGSTPLGESVAYLVDLPLDARGKAPNLKKQEVLLFARAVKGRPGEIQLVSPEAQQLWTPEADAEVRRVLQALVSPDAPAKVTGVREILYVPGTLAGQGETQIFLSTKDGSAASITVRHEPGRPPIWGASFSELIADVGNPPRRDTLEWYRLACFLPNALPPKANVSEGFAARRQAESDYRMVLGELGVCRRTLGQGV
ncbi:hypothetical protein [Novosphingobium pentaromativorans]|uniref:Uncharacterized protein n=1 Tax=Novosphingobium pentaromativorans US6-1 TaxID=1088721 RepID=G6EC45_9SPHN|nr:hypothetical protein [Novosphingobium pentaromativorans]AIT80169.1 hypothetical protein JI59_10475 [Novosphingobium pentaromativorans US6-1]EHJ61144.1 hypothetical protein NSU_1916 [Novosphingobium pentaromativorans US6-1]